MKPSPERACGYLVDRWTPRTGVVHSAYRSAANVQWDDGQWWFVVAPGTPNGPTSVIADPRAIAGERCWVRAGHLRIGQRTQHLSSATWTPPPWPTPQWRGLRQRLELLRRGASPLALALAEQVAAGQTVVGHGIGLTPTGDDVHIGWLAAHHALHRPVSTTSYTGTTDLSLELLRLAVEGHFHEPLRRALHAVLTDSAQLADAISMLHGVGSTSGHDTAAGAAMALQSLTEQRKAA